MATPVFCCGFECGLDTAHWTLGGTASFTTSSPLSGLRSLRCNPTGSIGQADTAATFGVGLHVMRFGIRFTTLPNAVSFLGGTVPAGSPGSGAYFNNADSKIYAGASESLFGATGVSVVAGVAYDIDVRVNTTANPHLIDVQVNKVACGQKSNALGADTAAKGIRVGLARIAQTGDALIDNVLLSLTSADYPLSNVKVLSLVPNADGTHTATTSTIVKGTIATPVGANVAGSTDVFNWLNARPILGGASDNTRLVNQQTAGATLYAEVGFEQTTEVNPPIAVEILTADREASTATCNFITKLNDNGTEADIINRGTVAGVTTDRFATKQFATMVGGGAWTLARFNALKVRFGYSSDATPDIYWRGVIIEVAFPTSLGAQAFGRPAGQVGQNQMQQLLAQ